jgi:hypothetical protein
MLRVGKMDVAGPTRNEIPDVAQDAADLPVSKASFATTAARSMPKGAALVNDLRLGQIFRLGDPLRGVRKILSGTGHGKALLGQLFPARTLPALPKIVTVVLPVTML